MSFAQLVNRNSDTPAPAGCRSRETPCGRVSSNPLRCPTKSSAGGLLTVAEVAVHLGCSRATAGRVVRLWAALTAHHNCPGLHDCVCATGLGASLETWPHSELSTTSGPDGGRPGYVVAEEQLVKLLRTAQQ